MGYTTDFTGSLNITPALSKNHLDYLKAFSYTRRMKRNAKIAETMPDELRIAVNLPIGDEAEFYVGSHTDRNWGQSQDKSIIDYNEAPGHLSYDNLKGFAEIYSLNQKRVENGECQPGLWCKWVPTDDGSKLEWNGAEKFYDYIEWLKYLISRFYQPWGYTLNGGIDWQGEDDNDTGKIIVIDNNVEVKTGAIG